MLIIKGKWVRIQERLVFLLDLVEIDPLGIRLKGKAARWRE